MDRRRRLVEHLEELRARLIVALTALALLSIVSYGFVDEVIDWMAQPAGGFVFFGPTEAFMVRLKLALILGGFLAVPVILYQAWSFVAVALAPEHRRLSLRILPASYALFVAGACCAWFAVIPAALPFLLGFATPHLKPMLSLEAYIGFAGSLTLAFGAMFQLPVVIFFLVKAGLVSPESLAAHRRHAVLVLSILAGVLTPGPDLFSQLALLLPTYLLYEISIWVARVSCPESEAEPAPPAPEERARRELASLTQSGERLLQRMKDKPPIN